MPVESWYALEHTEVERLLETGPTGLATDVATRRLQRVGPNVLEEAREAPWWALALHQVRDPLVYILLAAAGVTLTLRDYADTGVILAVVLINGTIGMVQEWRAREAMRALATLSAPRAQVVRDATTRDIASRELVPGDVVVLTSGSLVPADLRLVRVHDLAVDESVLTGESDAVRKHAAVLPLSASVPADQVNMAFAGTTVVHGRGRGVVVRTAAATELGRIADAMRAVGRTATPMEIAFAVLSRRVGLTIVALATLVLVIGLVRGMSPAEIFLTAVAVAVSAIPEGLPVVLTITLAVGVRRMAHRGAIIRSLPAVETLGSTTVIVSDKTGTLTRNEMTVRALWTDGVRTSTDDWAPVAGMPSAMPSAVSALLARSVLASEGDAEAFEAGHRTGDPIELALFAAAAHTGRSAGALHRAHPQQDLLPFESERRFMVSLRTHNNAPMEYLKGAPEVVLARCDTQRAAAGHRGRGDVTPATDDVVLDAGARATVLAAASAFAADGLRVLAIASRPVTRTAIAAEPLEHGFILDGLVGLDDPVRPEAITAVADARLAGMRVLMLTGDHVGTARTVGAQLGLGEGARTGHELERLSDEELDLALRDINIYARVTPEDKLRIVQRLKAAGEVVAVTGDGVNDAPALRAAHVGIAMGRTGSDIAREAADMVLADDNFATITAAAEEGRLVFANIRKVTYFLLSTAAGEILAVLASVLMGWPLPFAAAQILWINLVTDSLQVMALSFEPAEPSLRHQPPRALHEGVLTWRHGVRLAGVGVLLVCATLGMFHWTLDTTGDLALARTVAVTQMVVMQFYHVINCRSLDRSVFRTPPFSNRLLFVSLLAVSGAHVAALYVPVMQRVLGLVPLRAEDWWRILVVGLVIVLGAELDKAANRRAGRRLG